MSDKGQLERVFVSPEMFLKRHSDQEAWDRFAAAALQGLLSQATGQPPNGGNWHDHIPSMAKWCGDIADAMMEQRKARMG